MVDYNSAESAMTLRETGKRKQHDYHNTNISGIYNFYVDNIVTGSIDSHAMDFKEKFYCIGISWYNIHIGALRIDT